jgi:hypothetical protein
MTRSTAEPDPWPIRLDRAFGWVLACFEEVAGVDRDERRGLLPGQADPYEALGTAEGTGPDQYPREFLAAPEPHGDEFSLPQTEFAPDPPKYLPFAR